MKSEIKAEILAELQNDIKAQVNSEIENEVEKIEDVVQEIEDDIEKVEWEINQVEDVIEDVEDDVQDLESDQDDLETLFDISKVEIAAEWMQQERSVDITWWTAVRSSYIADDTVTVWRSYEVAIIQSTDGYTIVHDDFDISLIQQQCSTRGWSEIFAYYASLKDDAWNSLEWCANVML